MNKLMRQRVRLFAEHQVSPQTILALASGEPPFGRACEHVWGVEQALVRFLVFGPRPDDKQAAIVRT